MGHTLKKKQKILNAQHRVPNEVENEIYYGVGFDVWYTVAGEVLDLVGDEIREIKTHIDYDSKYD